MDSEGLWLPVGFPSISRMTQVGGGYSSMLQFGGALVSLQRIEHRQLPPEVSEDPVSSDCVERLQIALPGQSEAQVNIPRWQRR